ncbi:fibronectin type III domain-containing protein [Nocardioides ferulae]|uniref:fibronectin type III domain-containing protein n=1 Tax=Nocardioides ferulae TaxID=2340821 RepID=UPI0013DDAF7C|nr:fibronectin type III domain-containing protein [Nocardioides ferulae]
MPFRRRAVLGPALAAALAVSGLATLAPPATALVPDGGLRVLVAEPTPAGNQVSLGDVRWGDGTIYAARRASSRTSIVTYAVGESVLAAPTSATPIPEAWDHDPTAAFEVAPDGGFYLQAPRETGISERSYGWGVGRLASDGSIDPAAVPAIDDAFTGELAWASESVVMDPDGSGVLVAGARLKSFGSGGTSYGVAAEIPLPVPSDQQTGSVIVASADGWANTTATHYQPPFLPGVVPDARQHPRMGSIVSLDAKGPYVYLRETWYIHRVDRRTNEIVTLCCRQPDGWDRPAPVEGGSVDEAHLEILAGPVADRQGSLFVAIDAGAGANEIWQIRPDATLHHVAGDATAPEVSDGADPRSVRLVDVGDLDLDPDGNLYLTHNGVGDNGLQVLMIPGVAAADTAPSAPRHLVLTPGSGEIDLAWDEPSDDGGQPVLDYTVRAHPAGATGTGSDVVTTVTSRRATLTGLTDGVDYGVSVAATNSRGTGPVVTAVTRPTAYQARLTASPDQVTAGETVQLDAGTSHVPSGSTYEFFCDGRFRDPVASTGDTATCRYPRGSNDEGYAATVVVSSPDGAQTWTAADTVVVTDPPDTVEGSHAFDPADSFVTVPAAADGSLDSESCGAGTTGSTCVIEGGAWIVLTAAAGTLRAGSTVRIHQGDEAELQDELGSGVQAQGGFAVTWTDSEGRKYDLDQPLIVTVTPQSAADQRHARRAGWDVGAAFQEWGQSFVSGVSNLAGTIGSAFQFLGSAISELWASAAQSLTTPNSSRTNDVYQCSSFLVVTGAQSYRCDGKLTILRDVLTDRIAAVDAGARVVSAGGANVVSAGGANVVSAGGANVVSAGGANVRIEMGANSVISAGGANVVSAGGANVVSAGGANVVSAGGANVVSAGGANLGGTVATMMMLTRDPGFAFADAVDATPPTATVELDPPAPESGVYPYGSTVTASLSAQAAGTKSVQRVSYEVTGAQTTAYTIVDDHETELTVSGSGTSTLVYGAVDDQLVGSTPAEIEIRIAGPSVPAAPSAPTGVAGPLHDSVRFTWSAPEDEGDLPITGYSLQVTDHGLVTDGSSAEPPRTVPVTGDVTTVNVTGLLPGHRYSATVRAVSEAGPGAVSAASADVVTATTPQAASGLAPAAGDRQVALTWSPPLDTGGLPVTGYVVSRSAAVDGTFAPVGSPTAASFTDTGLTNGETYYYLVQARNHLGLSARSSVVSATPHATSTPPDPDPDPDPDPEPPPPDPEPQSQTLTFIAPDSLVYGQGDRELTASATSGLPVRFVSLSTDVCTVTGATLRVIGAGTCAVEAAQAGDADWLAAPSVTRTMVVARAPLTVRATWGRMLRGGASPVVAAHYLGLVAGDTPFDLPAQATCRAVVRETLTRCGGVESLDYEPTYVDGRLRVRRHGAAVLSTPLVHARVGEPIRLSLRIAGSRGLRVSWEGDLPDGVTARRDQRTGRLSFVGAPTAVGVHQVRVLVTGDGHRKAEQVVRFHTW